MTNFGGEPPQARQPIFLAPRVVTAMAGVLIAIHAFRLLLPVEWDIAIFESLVFMPSMLTVAPLRALVGLFGHMLLHANLLHLFVNVIWLVALATPLARRIGSARLILLTVLSGLWGAAAHALWYWGTDLGIIGASGAIAGMMGAVFRFALQPRFAPVERLPRRPLRDPRILVAAAAWTVVNVVFGLTGFGAEDEAGIAWQAHLGGFYFGLLAFDWFDRASDRRWINET